MLDALEMLFDLGDLGEILTDVSREVIAHRRSKQIASWPTAQATVLSSRIEERAMHFVLTAPYWFYADGERYGGRYEREFMAECQARDRLQRLLASPLTVSYKPGDPDTSVLDDD